MRWARVLRPSPQRDPAGSELIEGLTGLVVIHMPEFQSQPGARLSLLCKEWAVNETEFRTASKGPLTMPPRGAQRSFCLSRAMRNYTEDRCPPCAQLQR